MECELGEGGIVTPSSSGKLVSIPTSWLRENRALTGVLVVGLLLRLAPLLWGVPLSADVRSFHPDEAKAYQMTAEFPEVYLSDQRFITYGTTVSYTLGAALIPVRLVIAKLLDQDQKWIVTAHLASRLAGVLFGTGSILLAYMLGLVLLDRRGALLTAAFVAVAFYPALNSSVATLDVPMSFLVMANVLLWLRAFNTPSLRSYLLFGAATGMLMGTKLPGGLFFGMPFLLLLLAPFDRSLAAPRSGFWSRKRLVLLLAYVASGLVVYLAYHPHVVVDPGRYIEAYSRSNYLWVERLEAPVGEMLGTWVRSTGTALGWPITVLASVGVLSFGRRQWSYKLCLLVFVALNYLTWRWFLMPRFLIPVIPLLCLFAAAACGHLLRRRERFLRGLGTAAVALALASGLYSCAMGIRLRLADTRPPAARYLVDTFAEGTTLALSSISETYDWSSHAWQYPAVDGSRFEIVDLWEQPQLVVTNSRDLNRIERALESDNLGSDLVWNPEANGEWYNYSPPTPRLFRFYTTLLDPDQRVYELVEVFSTTVNVPIEFPPPEIRIYQRVSDPAR